MHPPYNSLPYHSSQIQTDGNNASADQQAVRPNPFQGNPSNLAQIQQQMGIINPQIAIPNGNAAITNRPISAPSSCFMSVPNQPFCLQNAMHPLGQFHNGFSQASGPFFSHSAMNLTPYYNQNVSLPNGQFCLQSPFQNTSQFVQMHYTPVVPGNLPLFQNQFTQNMGPQNPNFILNQQSALAPFNGPVQHGNQEQQRLISSIIVANASKQSPNSGQQLQGSSSSQLAFGSVQPQQAQNFRPLAFTKSQGNPVKNNGVNNANTKWETSQSRNLIGNQKHEPSQKGRFKSQLHHTQNAKGKFRFHNECGGKGYKNDGAMKSGLSNSTNGTRVEKNSLSLNYTEQEIQQWREDRKKNYPSNANIEKKRTLPEAPDRDAKLRRQQLKEILAKQAELGCEVAEVPSFYLSDSEKQGHARGGGNEREWSKKGRFQNKFNKRRKLHQNDRFAKKRRSGDHDPSKVNDGNSGTENQRFVSNDSSTRPTMNKREPTLLQKLHTADHRRDKSHLLQVFRFMVVNSFFEELPEKSLRFPSVIVRETGGEDEVFKVLASVVENAEFEGSEKTVNVPNCDGDNDNNNNNDKDSDETDAQHKRGKFGRAEGGSEKEVEGFEEEEGEIID